MRKACVALLLTLLGILQSGYGSAREFEDVLASGYIEMAVYRDFPPYSWLRDGQAAGIDIDVGSAIARELGLEARWHWITADETVDDDLRNAVWKGHYLERRVADLMLRVPYDREYAYARDGYDMPRNDLVVLLAPYHTEAWRLARNLEHTGAARTLAIFRYQPIGVETDSLPDTFLLAVYGGQLRNQVRHFATVFDALGAMRAGDLSAVAGMRSQLEWGLGAGAPSYEINADGLQEMGRLEWDIGLAVKHTSRELGHTLEPIVAELVQSGEIGDIFARYGVSHVTPALYASTVALD